MQTLFGSLLAALIALGTSAQAENGRAGEFDYYVAALSWSPNWCLRTGDAQDSPQCEKGKGHGWILHGLWPQYHRGYPSFCQTIERPPSRRMTAEMADIMGTPGLAWHQWKKHGSCTGLSAADYYALSRTTYEKIIRPPIFRQLGRQVKLPASVVEEAFLKANTDMEADGVTVTCRESQIQEVRICLSRDLDPVPCGQDVVRDCRMKNALFAPIR